MATISMQSVGLFLNGHYTEGSEYDYNVFRSNWIKNTKANRRKLEAYKWEHTHDYDRREYDCTGSNSVTVDIQRRGRYIRLSIITSVDC